MTDSDGNDKTRFKKTADIVSDAADRTKIVKPTKNITKNIADNEPSIESPSNTEKTRVQRQELNKPETSVSDKTQFASNKNPAKRDKGDLTNFSPRKTRDKADNLEASEQVKSDYPILKNRFVFEELLGAGGMGAVYKAKDLLKIEAQDREPYVAIKVLSDEFKTHPEAFMALQRESRKSQKIAHPNIVNVHDFDRDGDTVFMTMEYMQGKPLDKLISQYRGIGLPTEDVYKILEGICAALSYAHAQHIIHSDFKPGNIFVGNNGIAKVFDFGIARAVAKAENREESVGDKTVFDAGKLGALTPAYASLEMLEGKTPDIRDDIYALGCIAYELFTGDHPYNRVHADEAKRQKLKAKKIPGIKKHQWRAIERAIAFERENRSESVDAFWKEFNRKTSYTAVVVVFMLALIGGGVGGYYKFKPEKPVALTEEQLRGQVEQKLRLELKMKALTDLMAATDFSSGVEAQIWSTIQELRQLMGKADVWLVKQEADIYTRYIKEIELAIKNSDFLRAKSLTANAYRYAQQTEQLKALEIQIANAIEEKKRLEQEQLAKQQADQVQDARNRQLVTKQADVAAQTSNAFSVALSNVDKQLECKSGLDMKDFEIAITKLRSLDSAQYQKTEPRIVASLAQCIQYIGTSFPERAEAAKTYAMRIFNGNSVISAINITQKDPCNISLAGLGSRGLGASCKDKMSGVGRIPVLVVIPSRAGNKPFAIGKYEVSVDEFNNFCELTGACVPNKAQDGSLPITNISINNAKAYAKWLSDKSNRKYRLPTSIEWQHAARASTNKVDPNRNCKLNSRGIQKGDSLIKVSLGQQNDWGLVNYLGNAAEWTVERDGSLLVNGGSFDTPMEECLVTKQLSHNGSAEGLIGFRVLREVSD